MDIEDLGKHELKTTVVGKFEYNNTIYFVTTSHTYPFKTLDNLLKLNTYSNESDYDWVPYMDLQEVKRVWEKYKKYKIYKRKRYHGKDRV